jgi:predicted murein hydrolase (TIGR00659 family)
VQTGAIDPQIFSITLTLVGYWLARELYIRRAWALFNPLLVAPVLIIAVLYFGGMPYASYLPGAKLITFFLGPATVALAVPMYKQLPAVKKHLGAILVSIGVGSVVGIVATVGISRLLGASPIIAISLAAKSTTSPIAVGITQNLGGNTALVVIAVVITGILGGVAGPEFLKLLGVKDAIAIGLGMGAASHVGGTSRAVQLGELEGSMSGAAIAFMGIGTAVAAPWLLRWLL